MIKIQNREFLTSTLVANGKRSTTEVEAVHHFVPVNHIFIGSTGRPI